MRSTYGRLHGQITIDGITAEFDLSVDARAAGMVEQVLRRFQQRGNIPTADESPRPGKERRSWRDEEKGTESSAPTKKETNGESSLLKKEVRELVVSLRQKARRARQSASPSVISKGSRE
jgi:TATA-binding protein-associated factor Taf7